MNENPASSDLEFS